MIRDVLLDALAVLSPVTCASCGAADRSVCATCVAALVATPHLRTLDATVTATVALRYEGVARSTILALKEQGRTDAAVPLAAALATSIGSALDLAPPGAPIALVAMPVRRGSRRRRGFDPVRLLLRRAGMPRPLDCLALVPGVAEQKALDAMARAENSRGSMGVRGDIRGLRMLLVDDVVTTGSTLIEASRALRSAGAEVIGAAVLASTPKLFPDSHVALGQTRDIPRLRV